MHDRRSGRGEGLDRSPALRPRPPPEAGGASRSDGQMKQRRRWRIRADSVAPRRRRCRWGRRLWLLSHCGPEVNGRTREDRRVGCDHDRGHDRAARPGGPRRLCLPRGTARGRRRRPRGDEGRAGTGYWQIAAFRASGPTSRCSAPGGGLEHGQVHRAPSGSTTRCTATRGRCSPRSPRSTSSRSGTSSARWPGASTSRWTGHSATACALAKASSAPDRGETPRQWPKTTGPAEGAAVSGVRPLDMARSDGASLEWSRRGSASGGSRRLASCSCRRIEATRYVTPLREGGSLPAIVEADDDGLYVVKFRGAGQGPKALIAEVVAGELARALGLPVPELALRRARPGARRAPSPTRRSRTSSRQRRPEPRARLPPRRAAFDPAAGPAPEPELAAAIVWFDALITNVDRTARNTNMLLWHEPALADRPRRGALLPPRGRGARPARAHAVPADHGARAAAVRRLDRRGGRAARAAGDGRAAERDRGAVPDGVARRRRSAGCTPSYLRGRLASRARSSRGGAGTWPVARSRMPSTASCRGSSAASG